MNCPYCGVDINEDGWGENHFDLLNMMWSHLTHEHGDEEDVQGRIDGISAEIDEMTEEL